MRIELTFPDQSQETADMKSKSMRKKGVELLEYTLNFLIILQ